ncbi:hypothetical protein DLJ49_01340 [Rhodovulum sp. 12E13]|uniref:GumC family protein n=1 Tax=Rhodovulum sp. 12E13 TaxID=2203891 RepID=UPI000E15F815|nr:polysaccharide biosynthesis tyrosine autokinase [Rhodovulum sp. 12E13]RDC75419.1 hypothetical protein DLJ49_01340 [Rhodovulum sp. 12E13]
MNSRFNPVEFAPMSRARRALSGSAGDDADAVDLRALARAVWRGRWLVGGAMAGLGLAAYLVVAQVRPTYEATAKVMLDPRNAQIVTGEEVVQDLELSEQVVNGEAAVLSSNVLIERVVAEIGPLRLDADGEIGVTGEEAARLVASVADPDARAAADDRIMQGLVWLIRRDLTVFPQGDSYVIAIRAENHDPELAADIANAIARAYISAQIEDRRDTTTGATAWLEARVAELRADLDAAEAAVTDARAQGLSAEGGTVETVRQQLADLNGQLVAARADRAATEAQIGQLEAVLASGGLSDVADLVSSPLVEQMALERLELTRQDGQWAERYDESHPERQRIARELARLETELAGEVERIIAQSRSAAEVARAREDSLRAGIADLESRIVSITSGEQGLRQLEREAQAKRQTYEALLSRLTETRTQELLQQPDARLIERASVPGVPAAPRPKLMGALGAMAGLALGLGLIFVREMTAQTFRTPRDLEAATGLPVLGSVPLQTVGGLMAATAALRDDPYSIYAERIRHLRTALLMREGQEGARAVAVLSAAPDEGKTRTTLALAQMSALAGLSVIVVDADLRRSTMQAAFGWDMEEDFADFIRGGCPLDRAIYTDPEFGFDFLAARGPQPDVADRLSADWLARVVAELKRVYDVVLIDAPALLAVSDGLVLAQVVDARLFLVRWDGTPRKAVTEALAAMDEMGLDVTGAALTMIDPARAPEPETQGYTYA